MGNKKKLVESKDEEVNYFAELYAAEAAPKKTKLRRRANCAVYAGTFDPYTNGHDHIVRQAIPLFDSLTIAIGVNPAKKTKFSLADRLFMLQQAVGDYKATKIEVATFDNKYLVNYAAEIGAQFIIRGLRNSADFEYELSMAQINKKLNPEIRTVFLMADRKYADVSSSMVKSLIGPTGWQAAVKNYIPSRMWEQFLTLC